MEIKLECVHCHESNINYFQFGCLDSVSPQAKMNPMIQGNYEWLPKIPIGFYFKCSKCGKDTVIIPDSYSHREYTKDIPEHIIVRPVFEQPKFSITHYIMYDATGILDQVVIVQNNTIVSLNTKQQVIDDGSWHEITPTMFNMFKSRGFKEVGEYEQFNDNVHARTNIGAGQLETVSREMVVNDTSTTTSRDVKGNINDTSAKK